MPPITALRAADSGLLCKTYGRSARTGAPTVTYQSPASMVVPEVVDVPDLDALRRLLERLADAPQSCLVQGAPVAPGVPCKRNKEAFRADSVSAWLHIDVDHDTDGDPDALIARFPAPLSDAAAVCLYTSRHGHDGAHYRLSFRLSSPLPISDHGAIVRALNAHLDEGGEGPVEILDASIYQPERLLFTATPRGIDVPHVDPRVRIVGELAETVDTVALLDWVSQQAPSDTDTDTVAPSLVVTPGDDTDRLRRETGLAVGRIRRAAPGQRNNTLDRAAYYLAGIAAADHVDVELARPALRRAALEAGLTDAETEATISSGFASGAKRPVARAFALTDLGNAERFVAHSDGNYLYSTEIGWLHWAGTHWQPDTEGLAVRAQMGRVARLVVSELPEGASKATVTAYRRHAARSEGRGAIAAALALAEPMLSVDPSRFNKRPDLLVCSNGTVELRTGTLRPSHRDDLLTKSTRVSFDPHVDLSRWTAFLNRVQPDPEVRAFLQRWSGYCATAEVWEECLVFHHGDGRNGKSTYTEAMRAALGDYAVSLDTSFLAATRDKREPWEIARLQGARFAVVPESKELKALDEQRVKQLTGDDSLEARHMRREAFEFAPTHKINVHGNHRPIIRGTDLGIWRRLRLVPWTVTISELEKDETIKPYFRKHPEIALAWVVAGAVAWYREKLSPPAAVTAAVESYRSEEDLLGRWLDDCCDRVEGDGELNKTLYQSFQTWLENAGEKYSLPLRAFAHKLKQHGFVSRHSMSGALVLGLRLKNTSTPTGSVIDDWASY